MMSEAKRQGQQPAALAPVLARSLAALAFENSMNKSISTPYSAGASEFFDMVYHGGKPDDVTVCVCIVT